MVYTWLALQLLLFRTFGAQRGRIDEAPHLHPSLLQTALLALYISLMEADNPHLLHSSLTFNFL